MRERECGEDMVFLGVRSRRTGDRFTKTYACQNGGKVR
jgi:hypothetical protein